MDTLAKFRVNILVQEGLSDRLDLNDESAHRLSLIIDLAKYVHEIDGSTSRRSSDESSHSVPNFLITEIIHNSARFIRLDVDRDRWAFDFRRMRYFYQYRHHQEAAGASLIGHELRIAKELLTDEIYKTGMPKQIACHMISDTEEKYLKIKFLSPQDKYLLLSIEHREEVGAIYRFTDLIAGRNINILNSYSRISAMDKRAFWNCFLQIPDGFKQADLLSLLQELNDETLVTNFSLGGDYGFSFDVPKLGEEVADLNKFYRTKPAKKIRSSRPVPDRQGDEPSSSEKALGVRPFYLGKKWKRDSHSVFVAMPFDTLYDVFYAKHVAETLLRNGLSPVRADKVPVEDPNRNIMEVIQEQIAVCDFMVADVTTKNANVLYEVGLAHAIGRKVLIICQADSRSAGKDILFDINGKPHVFYSPFQIENFDQEFERCIKDIIRGIQAAGEPGSPSRAVARGLGRLAGVRGGLASTLLRKIRKPRSRG
jgi:nucleoside 2-deoxyribosyltransferase